MYGGTKLGCSIISSAAISNICGAKRPSNFAVIATALGRELGVPMRMCNLAYAEMLEACNRGWQGRDSRSVMLLQEERAGVKIAADPEHVKQAAQRAKAG